MDGLRRFLTAEASQLVNELPGSFAETHLPDAARLRPARSEVPAGKPLAQASRRPTGSARSDLSTWSPGPTSPAAARHRYHPDNQIPAASRRPLYISCLARESAGPEPGDLRQTLKPTNGG